MKTEKELKEEIKEARMNRRIEISEDIWKRFESGEVNLIDNLLNEFYILIKYTSELERLKAQLKILQERNAKIKQAIEDIFNAEILANHEDGDDEIEKYLFAIKKELLEKLGCVEDSKEGKNG